MDYNKTTLLGRLTKDAEIRFLGEGSAATKVANTTLAVQSSRKSSVTGEYETDFFVVSAFGSYADVFEKRGNKGETFLIAGEVSAEAYSAKDGTPKASLKLTVKERPVWIPRNSAGTQSSAPAPQQQAQSPQVQASQPQYQQQSQRVQASQPQYQQQYQQVQPQYQPQPPQAPAPVQQQYQQPAQPQQGAAPAPSAPFDGNSGGGDGFFDGMADIFMP